MPDKDVTLTGSATPTISWTFTDPKNLGIKTEAEVKWGESKESTNSTLQNGAAVEPGKWVSVKVKGYYVDKGCEGITGYGGYADFIPSELPNYSVYNPYSNDKAQPNENNLSTTFTFTMPSSPVSFSAYYTNDASAGPCVSEDTMITLADGTQKRVDELTGSETLLTWNHKTGSYDTAPIAYLIDHGGVRQEQPITHLFFTDGSDLEIIGEHVFYNADTGKYITLDENAADYIGTHFAKQNAESGRMERVALTEVKHEVKLAGIYEVVTNGYMTCFTDGILTASAYIDKLLNTFDIETDTMAYNPFKVIADIQTYGLYTYEDLQELGLTEAQFNMHNGAFLKIAVGKGTLTWQDMSDLMDMFHEYANEMPAAETNVQPNSMAEELPKMFGAYFAAKGQQAVDSVGRWIMERLY